MKRFYQTERGKKIFKERNRLYYSRNKQKVLARCSLAAAVRAGKIVKPTICEHCGKSGYEGGRIEAHHTDYTQRLNIQWLCRLCHYKADKGVL